MLAVVSVLVIVTLSLLITRVATVALTLTGMSREDARFQARSALTGTGFTTRLAEDVMSHPVRRRIVMLLMLVGSAGFVTAVATLLLSFTGAQSTGDGLRRAAILLVGLLFLLWVFRSRVADRWLSRIIERLLRRWGNLHQRDQTALLRLARGWLVAELAVAPEDWIAGRTLAEMDLPHEGVLVLGIERTDGRYVGAPKGSARIHPGDVLVLYGSEEVLEALDTRPRGEAGDQDRQATRSAFRRKVEEEVARDG
jgi:hypothetical protein